VAAIGAALILASLPSGMAAAGSSDPTRLSAAERRALPAGVHRPSAAERRALPAALRSVAVALSGPVYVWNQHSAKCMAAYHGTANGSPVQQYTCNQAVTERWTWVQSGFYWHVVNLYSGRCLDTSNNHADGVGMIIWDCSGNSNQTFWRTSNSPSGYVWRFGPQWNTGKCVEVYHSSYLNGASVDHYQCNGTQTQDWSQSPA
jgi:hypothetical protein